MRAALRIAAAVTGAVLAGTGVAVALAATGDGSPGDANIAFVGRWDRTNSSAYVPNWAGAYLRTGFTGTTVKLKQRGTIDVYFSIDGGAVQYTQNVSGTVNLTPTKLAAGNHTLMVSYRVVAGSYTGDAVFQGLVLDSGAKTLPANVSPKLVEFVGDSITVGTTSSKNALTAYGWLTGEQLGVRHTQIGYGGGCLVATADGCVSVAAQFLKTGYSSTSANWDFSRYTADAVVINLGTNDKSHGVSSADFQAGYVAFIKTVRGKYPNAAILALETFSKRYAAETQAAVATQNTAGDRNVYYVNTEGWLPSDGLSDSVHPNDKGHQAITAKLAPIVAARLTPTTSPSASTSPSSSTSPSATTPPPAGRCSVAYKITNSWQGGFQGDVTITNQASSAVNGWALRWAFAGGQTVTQAWNATTTQSGTAVTASNATWNATIPAGGTAAFGFTGTWTSINPAPTDFTLNGTRCAAV
ncbi:cellulose binding domain-containing protein [Dactylosporangium sp. McL0621]|uniref:cellulose binding domain-containing protein n=1 Tax=Dactylosporangium sp. McL0621 TaxID=3415678 RepID=UPI003CE781EA